MYASRAKKDSAAAWRPPPPDLDTVRAQVLLAEVRAAWNARLALNGSGYHRLRRQCGLTRPQVDRAVRSLVESRRIRCLPSHLGVVLILIEEDER